MNSQQELLDAIKAISDNGDRSYDTPATVLRVDGDTVWVHIDGGADETPVSKTINCEQGETVQVRISNGSAFLVGNASAPPTDDKTANVAHFVAEQADIKAVKAEETATEVKETVEVLEVEVDGKVDIGTSNIQHLSSTMYQNANGVNIYNDTLAVGDSYAHIDGDSFDIKKCTTAGEIDDANDTMIASFGREVTVGTRASGTEGQYSQVFGTSCIASGVYSHAEGLGTQALDGYAHAEGAYSHASGFASHAEGYRTEAGYLAHSEGEDTDATGYWSHAEGNKSESSGDYSHAEGSKTEASGTCSHSEGSSTEASGNYSHAEGFSSVASGAHSHAQNAGTLADSDYQTAIGKFNISDSNDTYALIIGNGSSITRSDALRVKWNGDVLTNGEVQTLNGNRKYVAEPSSEGTNGQVLTTDGAGGRTWTTVSGGGGVSNAYKNVKVGATTITASGEDTIEFEAGTNITLTPDSGNKKVIIAANNTPTVLTSTTISAATTSYTFTDAVIKADSVIDIHDTIFGFNATNAVTVNGSCTITFQAQSSSHQIKLFVY